MLILLLVVVVGYLVDRFVPARDGAERKRQRQGESP